MVAFALIGWDTGACAQAQTHTTQTNIKSAMAAMIEWDISHPQLHTQAQTHTKKHKQNIT